MLRTSFAVSKLEHTGALECVGQVYYHGNLLVLPYFGKVSYL